MFKRYTDISKGSKSASSSTGGCFLFLLFLGGRQMAFSGRDADAIPIGEKSMVDDRNDCEVKILSELSTFILKGFSVSSETVSSTFLFLSSSTGDSTSVSCSVQWFIDGCSGLNVREVKILSELSTLIAKGISVSSETIPLTFLLLSSSTGGTTSVSFSGIRLVDCCSDQNDCEKPNYEDVWNALCSLREFLLAEDLRKLSIPKLACGQDNLDWRIIRSMLELSSLPSTLNRKMGNLEDGTEISSNIKIPSTVLGICASIQTNYTYVYHKLVIRSWYPVALLISLTEHDLSSLPSTLNRKMGNLEDGTEISSNIKIPSTVLGICASIQTNYTYVYHKLVIRSWYPVASLISLTEHDV
ncbi:unnamed protein product [Acanthoscelides obtectus]|uniref:Uncharacterized protein n=1 Tax=Acanthoscelides obtectus TaxID=200917 RepID=A0A9P0NWR9_ACAOB|nr:unnamed protein product [Acanthoscelides obtectus]CAK1633958.1 hypothetical protein AOBTE_LOCUS8510 [Acanthoscelides obtectus]